MKQHRIIGSCIVGLTLLVIVAKLSMDIFPGTGDVIIGTALEKNNEKSSEKKTWNVVKDIFPNKYQKPLNIDTKGTDDLSEYDRMNKNEQNSVSDFVTLRNEVDFNDFNEYEKYLVFQNKENVQCAYLYESDSFYISPEQAMNLCAELLLKEKPDLKLEEVMADDEWGYVGYQMNDRELVSGTGDKQMIINKIGTLGITDFDNSMFEIYLYEDITDDFYRRTPITATFHFFLKDKLLVLE